MLAVLLTEVQRYPGTVKVERNGIRAHSGLEYRLKFIERH